MTGEHFAMIPVEVLTSEACVRKFPNYAVRVLLAIAAQYRGNNNGDIALTSAIARTFGITSKWQLIDGLALLVERGLIAKTRQGGKKPLGPCLYAVTWRPIDDLHGKIECGPTTAPSHAWAQWKSAPPEDQYAINQQHPRRTASAPQEDRTEAISAPPGDQFKQLIGTSRGAPSRSWPEGTDSPAQELAVRA